MTEPISHFRCPPIPWVAIKLLRNIRVLITITMGNSDPSGRTVYGVGLRPPACCDCGFEFRGGHGCLFLVGVVCWQVEVSASG